MIQYTLNCWDKAAATFRVPAYCFEGQQMEQYSCIKAPPQASLLPNQTIKYGEEQVLHKK